MADNITLVTFSSFFAYTMDCILQALYGYCDKSIYWILGPIFFLHIISPRKWLDNKDKNEALLEIMNNQLTGSIPSKINFAL